jgi:hypothetical protein
VRTDYAIKLQDPRWQKKRLKALEIAEWQCQECGATDKTLHVHHKKYKGEPWDIPESDLQVLCKACHAEQHAKPRFRYYNADEHEAVCKLSGSTAYAHKMMEAILHRCRCSNSSTINVTSALCRQFGINERQGKARSLRFWESLGVIQRIQVVGKNPKVVLLKSPAEVAA